MAELRAKVSKSQVIFKIVGAKSQQSNIITLVKVEEESRFVSVSQHFREANIFNDIIP